MKPVFYTGCFGDFFLLYQFLLGGNFWGLLLSKFNGVEDHLQWVGVSDFGDNFLAWEQPVFLEVNQLSLAD